MHIDEQMQLRVEISIWFLRTDEKLRSIEEKFCMLILDFWKGQNTSKYRDLCIETKSSMVIKCIYDSLLISEYEQKKIMKNEQR